MVPLKPPSVVKVLVYKEFIDSTIYMLVGLEENERAADSTPARESSALGTTERSENE